MKFSRPRALAASTFNAIRTWFGKYFTVLDRYLMRKYLGTFIFSLFLLLAIVMIFDVNEKLDALLKAPIHATLYDYYLNFIPYFANQFAPLFTFIAVIFFTSKLAGNSEIIAMLSAGMSFKRFVRPYMVSAAIIAIGSFILSAYVIPPANVKRINYTNTYVKNKRVDYGANIMFKASPDEIAYFSRYDNISKMGTKVSLETFDSLRQLTKRITAQSVRWDTLYNWKLNDYTVRVFDGPREYVTRGRSLDTILPFEPRDFLISTGDWETMTTPALSAYIERQQMRGVGNIRDFQIEYHRRFATTAAFFILTIIGVSLSSRKVKGGLGLNLGIGLVLSFSYILFMTITQAFAVSGLTSPMVAMWIPNIVYAIIALILYKRAAK
jgi:lipopolysaccharide export system permease protein